MTIEIALVPGLVVSAVILFATERLPMDLTGMRYAQANGKAAARFA